MRCAWLVVRLKNLLVLRGSRFEFVRALVGGVVGSDASAC